MTQPQYEVVRIKEFSDDLAHEIGALQPFLNDKLSSEAVSEDVLKPIIEQSAYELIVGISTAGRVIGASVLSLRRGIHHNKGWLEDFVVDPSSRGSGLADAIADEWEVWNREQDSDGMNFTSGWSRVSAHKFYLKRGARILNQNQNDPTAYFDYPIPAAGE